MAIEEISYEEYMTKIEQIEKRYLSDEEGFPPEPVKKAWKSAGNLSEKSRN